MKTYDLIFDCTVRFVPRSKGFVRLVAKVTKPLKLLNRFAPSLAHPIARWLWDYADHTFYGEPLWDAMLEDLPEMFSFPEVNYFIFCTETYLAGLDEIGRRA